MSRRVGSMMAKAEKTKLPKELGGFKLAKAIRKAQPIEELMSTPEGRALLSETVLAGMGAALEVLRRAEPAADPTENDPEPRDSRLAATRVLADGVEGAMKAWTDQFGPTTAEPAAPRKVTRRRSPAPAPAVAETDAPKTPSRRKPRAPAAKPVPDDATLI